MRRVRTEPVVAVLLMEGEANFLEDILHLVLRIDRRLLRDYLQLARFPVGHHSPHHQSRREFHANRLRGICWILSPRSLDLAIWVFEELKVRLVAEEEQFPLFHTQFLRSLQN